MAKRKYRGLTLLDVVAKKPLRKNSRMAKAIQALSQTNTILADLRLYDQPTTYQVVSILRPWPGCLMAWSVVRSGRGRKRLSCFHVVGLTDDERLARTVCADLNEAAHDHTIAGDQQHRYHLRRTPYQSAADDLAMMFHHPSHPTRQPEAKRLRSQPALKLGDSISRCQAASPITKTR